GRPTKAPLLKITQGSSGPLAKRCQNTRMAEGTRVSALTGDGAVLRVKSRTAMVTAAAPSRTTSTNTASDLPGAGVSLVSRAGTGTGRKNDLLVAPEWKLSA